MDTKLAPPSPPSSRRRRGQSLAEFALTLPILLLLMFGIIEFARIFQAWVTLQNAARTAARYAITGQVDLNRLEGIADDFARGLGRNDLALESNTHNYLCVDGDHRGSHADYSPYDGDTEALFANHWDGLDCEPGSEDHQGLINDIGRIPSIRDQARVGAAGLDVRIYDEEAYVPQYDPGTGAFLRWFNDDKPGWFHVFICSSRPTLREGDTTASYDPPRYIADRDKLTCTVLEERSAALGDDRQAVNNKDALQWDAGGPGDAVEIIVTFNHPLITPLALPTYVQLQARRVMVNEAFRASRVVNLPPVLALPTSTPSNTPPPTITATITDTFEPTDTATPTHTPTNTGTPTATATPDCTLIDITGLNFSGRYLQVSIRNQNFAPLVLEGVRMEWVKNALFPSMYADQMQWNSTTIWIGTDGTPPTVAGLAPGPNPPEGTWYDNANKQLPGNSTRIWQVRFASGPNTLSDYFGGHSFNGTTFYLSNGCTLTINQTPPSQPDTPVPPTPIPDCGYYTMRFEAFWPHGVVQFSLINGGGTPIQIQGINLRWRYYFNGMNLNFIAIGGNNAFDSTAVRIWQGNDTGTTVGQITNTAAGTLGSEGTWLTNATVNPGDTVYMWLDFDGTSGNLQTDYDAHDYDFNGTVLAYDNGCNIQPPVIQPPPEPVCGDGVVQSDIGEQCDDGNTVGGDGCDANCQIECGNNRLDGSEQCDDGNRTSGDGCSSSCRTEYCGDGTRQSALGEQCDDGNTNNTDACDNNCRLTCGNGVVNGSEQCDDGNRNSGDGCSDSCRREYCGDGTRQSGLGEQCDDGNTNNGDGCNSSCQVEPPVCGNGRTESGEECDDGNSNNTDRCTNSCRRTYCGDGNINTPNGYNQNEQCDDGNTNNGDGCSSSCQIETAPTEECGNGIREGSEECDLGGANGQPGSGCTIDCRVSQGGAG